MKTIKHIALATLILATGAQANAGISETVSGYWSSLPSVSLPSMETVKSYVPTYEDVQAFVTENATLRNGVIAVGSLATAVIAYFGYKKYVSKEDTPAKKKK